MVDIETTGLNPGRHAIIQLSAVPFDMKSRRIGTVFSDNYLLMPPWRSFDTDTLQWWLSKNRVVYNHICEHQGDITSALGSFSAFVEDFKSVEQPNFWMRRPFDWMFVESYYKDFSMKCPFSYKHVIEMTSFMKGTALDDAMPVSDVRSPEGEAHNAYYDCKAQINLLFAALALQEQ